MSVPPGDAPNPSLLPGTVYIPDSSLLPSSSPTAGTPLSVSGNNHHQQLSYSTSISVSETNNLTKQPSSHVIRINSHPDLIGSENNPKNVSIAVRTSSSSSLSIPSSSTTTAGRSEPSSLPQTHITIPANTPLPSPSTATTPIVNPAMLSQSLLPVSTAITIKEIPYIPLSLARQSIEHIHNDMVKQRERHGKALQEVSQKYSIVEEQTKRQFAAFATKVRQDVADQLTYWKGKSQNAETQIQDLLQKQQALSADDNARTKIVTELQDSLHKAQNEAQKEAQEVLRIQKEIQQLTLTLEGTKQSYEKQIHELDNQIKRETLAHEEALKKAKEEATTNLLLAQQAGSESSKNELAAALEKERTAFQDQIRQYEQKLKTLETEKRSYTELIEKLQNKITQLEAATLALPSSIAAAEATTKIIAESSSSTTIVKEPVDDALNIPLSSSSAMVIPSSTGTDESKYVSTAKRIDASRVGLLAYIDRLNSLVGHTKSVITAGETGWGEGKKREVLRAYQMEATDLEAILPTNSNAYTTVHNALLDSESKRAEGLIGKAAFALKQGLDGFVNQIETEINSLRAAFIPPSTTTGTSSADDLSIVTNALRIKAAEAEARAVDAESRLQDALNRLDIAKQEMESAKANAITGVVPHEDETSDIEEETEHDHPEDTTEEIDKSEVVKTSTPNTPAKTASSTLPGSKSSTTGATPSGTPGNASAAAAAKVKEQEKTIKDLKTKIKQLEVAANKMAATAGAKAANTGIDEKALTAAVEKAKKEMEKKAKTDKDEYEKDAKKELDAINKKLTKTTADLEAARTALAAMTGERDDLKKRTGTLGELEKEVNALRETAAEAKTLASALKQATARSEELEHLYREEQTLRKRYWNALEDLKGKIRVYARVRPVSQSELDRGTKVIVTFPDEATIDLDTGAKGHKQFVYDRSFGMGTTQDEVFNECENLVQSALDGYNVCIFAYGQTGSGKTHTMVGSKDYPGLTMRSIHRLYDLVSKNAAVLEVKVSIYMVELYNDNLVDLLLDSRSKADPPKLEIKKDDKGVITIKGVTMKECTSAENVLEIFDIGNSARHVGSTLMNATSSRSHLIFALFIEAFNRQTKKTSVGKLSFVDLAGSERVGKTGATADRLKEAQAINKSLSALGNVISALSTNEKFIPYRDNKLTQLLSDGLGGNAKTLMFVNLSPVDYNADESLSSLIYASRVKLITNSAEKQVENTEIQRLKKIIAQLRAGNANAGNIEVTEEESSSSSSGAVLDDTGEVNVTE